MSRASTRVAFLAALCASSPLAAGDGAPLRTSPPDGGSRSRPAGGGGIAGRSLEQPGAALIRPTGPALHPAPSAHRAAAGGGAGQLVWDNGFNDDIPPVALPASQAQSLDCAERFAFTADDVQMPIGTVVDGLALRISFFGGDGNPAPDQVTGVWVQFWADDQGEPSDTNTILGDFVITDFTIADEGLGVYRIDGSFPPGAAHVASGNREWISLVPIMVFPPQTALVPTTFTFGTHYRQSFDTTNGTCQPWPPSATLGTVDVMFQLFGELPTGGSSVVTFRNGPGVAGCAVRITPTTAIAGECGLGSCEVSFGTTGQCFAQINSTAGLNANLLAQFLAIDLQNKINAGMCGAFLAVQAAGPRLILLTSDGPRPRPCLSVGGAAVGILGGPNQCAADGCNYHFQVGPAANEVLPAIGSGTDTLATALDCMGGRPGEATWISVDLPEGFFDRPGLAPSHALDADPALAGVPQAFGNNTTDHGVARADTLVFGECSGDFTNPQGPGGGLRQPDGVVDQADADALAFCQANGGPDCGFFNYDGVGAIDAADQSVFQCLRLSGDNPECCPPNLTLPQAASRAAKTSLDQLHLRSCEPLVVTRQGQEDWPENWSVDVVLSVVAPSVAPDELGPCQAADQEQNDVLATARNLGLLSTTTPLRAAGAISSSACDGLPLHEGSFDADVYRFNLGYEENVDLDLNALAGTTGCAAGGPPARTSLWLFTAGGVLLASSDPGAPSGQDPRITRLLEPGTYHVLVAGASQVGPPNPTNPECSVTSEPGGGLNVVGSYELTLRANPKSEISVTQTSDGGGTFDVRLLLQQRLAFSKVADPFHTVLVDAGELGEDARVLHAQGHWVREITDPDLGALVVGDPHFIPGVEDLGGNQQVRPIQLADAEGIFQQRLEPATALDCETTLNTCAYVQSPSASAGGAVGAAVNATQDFPLAENFIIAEAGSTLRSLTVWTSPAGVTTTDYVFEVRILGQGQVPGGCPGPDEGQVLHQETLSPSQVRPTQLSDVDQVTLNFSAPFNPQPGTTYWLELVWNSALSDGDQPFFVRSLAGDGSFWHDIIPEASGDGCTATPDGDGWDCIVTPDDLKTADCDETNPDGDIREGNLAFCLGTESAQPATKQLPADLARGTWRSEPAALVRLQPFAVREDGFVGTFSDVAFAAVEGGRQAADDFVFFEQTAITEVRWRGGYSVNNPVGDDDFTIQFYSDAGGVPGAMTHNLVVPPANLERMGSEFAGDPGRQVFSYRYVLPAPIVIPGNSVRWISVVNDNTGRPQTWFFGFAGGGDSNGRAASRDITGGIGTWGAEPGLNEPATDYSFDLGIAGTRVVLTGDSVDCTVKATAASGLGYLLESDGSHINGYQPKSGPEATDGRWRNVSAPWKFFATVDVDPPLPANQAEQAFADAGIAVTPEEIDCLLEPAPGGLIAAVFEGLAAYDASLALNGTETGGRIEQLCDNAVLEQEDAAAVLIPDRMMVKGILWSNQRTTFLTRGSASGECTDRVAPVIVHGTGLPGQTRPFSGYIDPRLESTNGLDVDLGLDRVTLVFSEPVFGPGGAALEAADFLVTQTGGGNPPGVSEIVTSDGITVTVVLDRVIAVRQWTTVIANVWDLNGCNRIDNSAGNQGPGMEEPDRVDVAFLPADIDQSSVVQPTDLLRFRQYILQELPGGICAACPHNTIGGTALDYFDTDRNGTVQSVDFLRYRQLLAGTGNATRVWGSPPENTMSNAQP